MKINVQSNLYTFIYASVMVILVALALSMTFIKLKPLQQANMLKEKQQAILASIGIKCERDQAPELFEKYFSQSYVVDIQGNILKDVNPLKINLEEEYAKDLKDRRLPVFVGENQGRKFFVLSVFGKGLWGPIWGYLALEEDLNTIYGVVFDHKGETPGLGAEITEPWYQKKFVGKKIFDENGNFVSIAVVKGGAKEDDIHAVDAISGGTLTSKGLEAMLHDFLAGYVNFLKKLQEN